MPLLNFWRSYEQFPTVVTFPMNRDTETTSGKHYGGQKHVG
jgi:hypothetical protein